MPGRSRLRLASMNLRKGMQECELDEDQEQRLRDARETIESVEGELRLLEEQHG
jgi:hypothetical protein